MIQLLASVVLILSAPAWGTTVLSKSESLAPEMLADLEFYLSLDQLESDLESEVEEGLSEESTESANLLKENEHE